MSIKGVCIPSGRDYVKAGWNNLVFRKEDLNDENWLYVGQDSEEGKKDKQEALEWHMGFMWILEE
jgi:hypothetical protein